MIERCRLCGSDKLRLCMTEGRHRDLNYYRCGHCALWNYDLSLGMDQTQYTERYVSPDDDSYRPNADIRRSWRFLRQHAGRPGRIMDIGCGNGCLLHLARQEGWTVRGMELSESAAGAIRQDQNIDVEVASFLDYDNADGARFDVVVLRHVLEHLPDSVLAMQRIGNLLKDNGLALLEFPNTRSFSYAMKRFLKNRGLRNRKYPGDWRPGHCNEFCRQSFEYLLDRTGFELVVWQTYSNKPVANALYRFFPIASKARALVRKKASGNPAPRSGTGFEADAHAMNPTQGGAPARRWPVAIVCLANTLAAAGDPGDLDEIVVSATRLETSIREAAQSITVIDKERIQNGTQQLGLDEALASVPGLYMQNRYNFSQDLRISLRGFGARSSFGIRGIKVIVDGIPETLPDGQAQVDSIDLGSAERIEVLRGPASAQYGNASGGVIAVNSETGGEESFVQAGLAGGELGYNKVQFKTGGRHRALDYLLNLSRQDFDGYREHSAAESKLINAKFGYRLNESDRLSLTFNHTDQPSAEDPGGISAAQAAADRRSARDANLQFDAGEALDQQRLGIVYDRARAAGKLSLRNYYVWRDFANKLPFTDGGSVSFDRFFYGAGAQYTLGNDVPEPLQVTFGADIERQDDDRLRFDNNDGVSGDRVFDQQEQVGSGAVFAQAQYRLNDDCVLSAGLRYDRLRFEVTDRFTADGDDSGSIHFDHLSPSFGVNYSFGGHSLFASFSSSFETPTTTELANPDASGGFNPALEPQQADSYELGFRSGGDSLSFELAAFRIALENELVPFELPAFPGRTFFSNAGRSDRRGVETAIGWSGDNGFGIDASYTYSDFTFDRFVDENGNDFSGRQLPGLPGHFGYLAISWQSARGLYAIFETTFSGELFATNANDVAVDRYAVSNFRLSRELDQGRWRVRPYVGLNNVFDEAYNSNVRINAFGGRYFEPAPPRNVYAGVVVNFQPGGAR